MFAELGIGYTVQKDIIMVNIAFGQTSCHFMDYLFPGSDETATILNLIVTE